jgi:hypothetical protein
MRGDAAMNIFVTSDPKVEPIGVRVLAILPRIRKSARVKDAEMFRELVLAVVDKAHEASSEPSLKGTKRIGQLVRELQAALDDNPDVSRPSQRGRLIAGGKTLILNSRSPSSSTKENTGR